MIEKKSNLLSNGIDELARNKNEEPARLWRKTQINDWICIFLLFLFSLSIVLGKLCNNYGNTLWLQNSSKYITSPASVFSNVSTMFTLSHIANVSEFIMKQLAAVSKKFVNISQYDNVVSVTTSFLNMYGWLMRAATCGLLMTGFTWFIIYKDSSIPGVNPPFPFSPSKKRYSKASSVQINYIVGVLNGILIFIYMCL